MKKLIQTLLLLFLLSSTSVFCENPINEINVSDSLSNKKENIGVFEVGIGIKEKEIEKFKVNFIYCFPINSNLSWGIGAGFHLYYPNYFLLPLFANFRAYLFADKTTPYLSVNTGYNFHNDNYYNGFFLNPTVGVSFKKSKGKSLDIGIGYDMGFENDLHYSIFRDILVDIRDNGLFSINLGLSF